MIPDPAPNTVTRPYRGLSVQEVQVPLTGPAVAAYLLGREVYRRTDYLVLRSGAGVALVAVRRAADEVTSTGTSLPASTCAHATARPGQGRTAGAGVGRTAGRC